MSKYVIIGCSAGGIAAAEAIREIDPSGQIIMISEENIQPYSRPMLIDLLCGDVTISELNYHKDDFWIKNNINILTGKKAVDLDFLDKCVTLDDGADIHFEKLLIATGGKPLIPEIEGVRREGVFTFSRFSDAKRLAEKLRKGGKAVVIGGGLIGVGVSEALLKFGLEVAIVEIKERVLSLVLDEIASKMIENVMKEKGINIVTGKTVKKIQGKTQDEDEVHKVILDNNEKLYCDYVVFATGVVPRTELVKETRVQVKNGIIVDSSMRTTQPDVYACGDVTESYDYVLDEHRLLPLWPIAYMGGRVAGHNMAGKKSVYQGGTAMNSLNYFGVPIMASGIIPSKEGSFEFLTHMSQEKNAYRKIVLKENVVVGMLLVNEIKGAGLINYLMRNRVNVKNFKIHLATESFSLANLPAGLREKMFWGKEL